MPGAKWRSRPPRAQSSALTILHPNAAGVDVHCSDMHMLCENFGGQPDRTTLGRPGLRPLRRRLPNRCDSGTVRNGDFLVVLGGGIDPDGERVKVSKTFGRKKDAAAWRDEQRPLLQSGRMTAAASKKTVGQGLARWLDLRTAGVTLGGAFQKAVRHGLVPFTQPAPPPSPSRRTLPTTRFGS